MKHFSIAFQAVPMASSYSNSTIGLSIFFVKQNFITSLLLFITSLPEIILLSHPLEELDFNTPPYNAIVLLSGRLPTLLMNLGLPFHCYRSGQLKYRSWIEESNTFRILRYFKEKMFKLTNKLPTSN